MKNKLSKTFCVHPWTNLMINSTGGYNFCCIAPAGVVKDDEDKLLHASRDLPQDVWNAKTMRDVRKAMLNGEKLDVCGKCWMQEGIGKESYRERHNKEWSGRLGKKEIERRVQYSIDNNFTVDTAPDYLDLRLGNLCNLKCRMCNVWNSSQIEKEHIKLRKHNRYADIWHKQWPGNSDSVLPLDMNWVNYEELWKNLNKYIPNLKKVYFTGGEPTLLETPYKFMEEMIAQGFKDKIDIMFNTNCTNAQPRFLKLISKFKSVQINGSIDGIGPINDYIRAPSKWKSIRENFIKIAKLPNVFPGMSPAIQIYNILDIENILNFADEVTQKCKKVIDVDFLLVRHPTYLNPSNLPDRVKDLAFLKLQRCQESWFYKESAKLHNSVKNSVDSYLNLLEKERDVNWKRNMEEFWYMTETLDKNRKQTFKDSIPDLYEMLWEEN